MPHLGKRDVRFLSTLSLRRATLWSAGTKRRFRYFYPRSPCGERLEVMEIGVRAPIFLSTLSLRRATDAPIRVLGKARISIHALLAESDRTGPLSMYTKRRFLSTLSLRRATLIFAARYPAIRVFLSTLSLRRATALRSPRIALMVDFYPRSPCGERPYGALKHVHQTEISIHALLAESDSPAR